MKYFITCRKLALLLICVVFFSNEINASQYHVSTKGKPTGRGTLLSPWDLSTALAHPFVVKAGDTIWLHGGVYHGCFVSRLKGSEEANILVRQYPNEIAVIKGFYQYGKAVVLNVKGAHTTYWGFSITCSKSQRISSESKKNRLISGLNILGHHTKFVNLKIYDNPGSGIGFWNTAEDSEVYGCIIFNNGWQREDKGTGHAIYAQNERGVKRIRNNIIFNGFSYGVHVYTEKGSINGFQIDRNIIFNNGILSKGNRLKPNIFVGGFKPADRILLSNNITYHQPDLTGQNIKLGYASQNDSISIINNHFLGGRRVLELINWSSVNIKGNTLYGPSRLVSINIGVELDSYVWDKNYYYEGKYNRPLNNLSFGDWKKEYAFDHNSVYLLKSPNKNENFIIPNEYETGRAHIVVLNWEKFKKVSINLSGVLKHGAKYKIFDVENLCSQPLVSGTYLGDKIDVPLDLSEIKLPLGNVPTIPKHTGLEFGVYLLVSE